jgi:hypothetical protein
MALQSKLEALIQETQALANAVQAQMMPKPISSAKLTTQMPREFSRPTQIEPISRAASSPEREDFFVKTLADARQGPRVTPPPRGT